MLNKPIELVKDHAPTKEEMLDKLIEFTGIFFLNKATESIMGMPFALLRLMAVAAMPVWQLLFNIFNLVSAEELGDVEQKNRDIEEKKRNSISDDIGARQHAMEFGIFLK